MGEKGNRPRVDYGRTEPEKSTNHRAIAIAAAGGIRRKWRHAGLWRGVDGTLDAWRSAEPTQVLIDPDSPEGKQSGLIQLSVVSCENLITIRQDNILKKIGLPHPYSPSPAKQKRCAGIPDFRRSPEHQFRPRFGRLTHWSRLLLRVPLRSDLMDRQRSNCHSMEPPVARRRASIRSFRPTIGH
jgi:hypothetical protein